MSVDRKRKAIESVIRSGEFVSYLDQELADEAFMIDQRIVRSLPRNFDRKPNKKRWANGDPMKFVIHVVADTYIYGCPTDLLATAKRNEEIGQVEFFLINQPRQPAWTIPVYLIYHDGRWWINAEEWFPFEWINNSLLETKGVPTVIVSNLLRLD